MSYDIQKRPPLAKSNLNNSGLTTGRNDVMFDRNGEVKRKLKDGESTDSGADLLLFLLHICPFLF